MGSRIKEWWAKARKRAAWLWRIISDFDTVRSLVLDSGLGPTIGSGLAALVGFVVTFVHTPLGVAIAVAATTYAATYVVMFLRRISTDPGDLESRAAIQEHIPASIEARPVDYELWGLVNEFTMDQAAALWAGIRPDAYYYRGHIDATRSLLREHILNGGLPCFRRNQDGELWPMSGKPRYTDIICRADLRRIAETVNDFPRFLFDQQGELFKEENGAR